MVAAGSLVPEGVEIPRRYAGAWEFPPSPAVRVNEVEQKRFREGCSHYVERESYKQEQPQ